MVFWTVLSQPCLAAGLFDDAETIHVRTVTEMQRLMKEGGAFQTGGLFSGFDASIGMKLPQIWLYVFI